MRNRRFQPRRQILTRLHLLGGNNHVDGSIRFAVLTLIQMSPAPFPAFDIPERHVDAILLPVRTVGFRRLALFLVLRLQRRLVRGLEVPRIRIALSDLLVLAIRDVEPRRGALVKSSSHGQQSSEPPVGEPQDRDKGVAFSLGGFLQIRDVEREKSVGEQQRLSIG